MDKKLTNDLILQFGWVIMDKKEKKDE